MDLQLQLARAVQVLNHDVLSCNRVAANQWLVQFQQMDAAWEVVTGILTADSLPRVHDFEVELFAAQILKRKIHADLGSLPPDGRSALQNALLLSATKYSAGPPQLLTQICLALSALILRSPESQKLIEQLFESLFGLRQQQNGTVAVLELLTVLPEEVLEQRTVASISSDRRYELSQEMLSKSSGVLKFLMHLVDNQADHQLLSVRRPKILRCLLSWVRIGCFYEVDEISVRGHPLIAFALRSLQAMESFDVAIDVLTELINKHEVVPPVLLGQMASVNDTLLLPALATRNEPVVKGLSCLMAELGQAAPTLITQGTPEALSLTDGLLRCMAYHSSSWNIAETGLPFWSALGDFVLANHQDAVKRMASAIYAALLDALIVRVQVGQCLYSDDDIDRSTGLPDGLAQFRISLEETLLTACRILGARQYVTQILSHSNHTPAAWQLLEAQFFLLYTPVDVILEGPPMDISPVVNVVLTMHEARSLSAFPLLHRSAAQVVGAFARWICVHPSTVLALLSFLAAGLSVPLAASACATSIRRISDEASLMSSEPTNLDCLLWIGEGMHKLKLSFKEEEEVICAIARALMMVTQFSVLNDAVHRLVRPSYGSLEALLGADNQPSDLTVLDASIRSLHRLGVLFGQLPNMTSKEEVFVGVLAQVWPLLEQLITSQYMENNSLAIATCKTLSEAIQAGGQYFGPLLPRIVKAISVNFLACQRRTCFIKLATCITEEFGHEEGYGRLFLDILSVFSSAEAVTSLNSSYACDQEPEIAEAYMNLMSTFLRNCPKEVVVAADLHVETCLNKATICCTAMHRGAAVSAMSYISGFLECTLTSLRKYGGCSLTSAMLRICSQNGENVVSGMLYALLGPSAVSRVYKTTNVLQQLAAVCHMCEGSNVESMGWSSLQCWIVSSIQALPSEYLRPGEADTLSATWLGVLQTAAADACANRSGSREPGYLHGHGGRSLKRVLREFADQHRVVNPICV